MPPRRGAAAERQNGTRRFARKAGIIVFWLAVWELLDHVIDNRLVLAGPIRTAQALVAQIGQPDFWVICGASFGRIALGFLLSFLVGFLLALISCRHRLFRDFVDPIISLPRTIPVASFIILLLIWVGNQALTVFLAFFIVLPLIYTNMVTGFESVDKQMLEMARVYKLSKWRTFLYIYRPAFMPFLMRSTKISLGMTWKSGIMAEVLATPKPSIGKEMATARTFLDTPFDGVDGRRDGGSFVREPFMEFARRAGDRAAGRLHRNRRRRRRYQQRRQGGAQWLTLNLRSAAEPRCDSTACANRMAKTACCAA